MRLIDIVLEWMLALMAGLIILVLLGVLSGLAGLIWTEYGKSQLTPVQLACMREAAK